MKRWRAKGPTVQAEGKGDRRSKRANESGRTLCFIRNFNIYRLYPDRISICIYPPFPSSRPSPQSRGSLMLMLKHSPRDFLLGSLPSRGPLAVPPSDHYRVINTADFRVASSHTHAHKMISALIYSTRHSARIPSSIPSSDKTVASSFFIFYILSPRYEIICHRIYRINVENFRCEIAEEDTGTRVQRGNTSM